MEVKNKILGGYDTKVKESDAGQQKPNDEGGKKKFFNRKQGSGGAQPPCQIEERSVNKTVCVGNFTGYRMDTGPHPEGRTAVV